MFDEEPEGDPHAECSRHIHKLEAKVKELKELLLLLSVAILSENWKEIGELVPRMDAAVNSQD